MSDISPEAIEAAAEVVTRWDREFDGGTTERAAKLLATWAVSRLAADRAEREERARPIDAEWCNASCDESAMYDGRAATWRMPSEDDTDVRLFVWDDMSCGLWWRDGYSGDDWNPLPITWNLANRGQLLDLLRVLKGGDA